MKYRDGREVRVGDRVQLWKNHYGTVVCSIDSARYSDDFPEEEWAYLKRGVLIKMDTEALFHYQEADEDFELIQPSSVP